MEVGSKAYSQEFESEADYLALYMLARAGFDINAAPDLWRRRAVQDPGSQVKSYLATHPSSPERAAAMTQTISEIEGKLGQRQALLPKTLEGQVLAVNTTRQGPSPAVVTAMAPMPAPPAAAATPQPLSQPSVTFAPVTQTPPAVNPTTPAVKTTGSRNLAQLYLIRGGS
jgi:hypothetical protein